MSPDEIKLNPDYETFDPCGVCLEIIENVFEPLEEEEITALLEDEWAEEPDLHESSTELYESS